MSTQRTLREYLRNAAAAAQDAGDDSPLSTLDLDHVAMMLMRRYSVSAQKPATAAALMADLTSLGTICVLAAKSIHNDEMAKRRTREPSA